MGQSIGRHRQLRSWAKPSGFLLKRPGGALPLNPLDTCILGTHETPLGILDQVPDSDHHDGVLPTPRNGAPSETIRHAFEHNHRGYPQGVYTQIVNPALAQNASIAEMMPGKWSCSWSPGRNFLTCDTAGSIVFV